MEKALVVRVKAGRRQIVKGIFVILPDTIMRLSYQNNISQD